MTEGSDLVRAVMPPHTIDDDEELAGYAIDKLAEAAAATTAVLDALLKANKGDERTLL